MERRTVSPLTRRRGRAPWVAALILVLTLVPALVAGAAVDDTSVVSMATDGTPADGPSGPGVVVSTNGRYVVFESTADNLSDADDDSVVNLYLRDRETGETKLVSRASGAAGVPDAGRLTSRTVPNSLLWMNTSVYASLSKSLRFVARDS